MLFHSVITGYESDSGAAIQMWIPRVLSVLFFDTDDCNVMAACPEIHKHRCRVVLYLHDSTTGNMHAGVCRPPRLCHFTSAANNRTSSRYCGLFLQRHQNWKQHAACHTIAFFFPDPDWCPNVVIVLTGIFVEFKETVLEKKCCFS